MLALTRSWESIMPPPTPVLALALLLVAPVAAAQTTLGEVLDQGAVKISGDEFRRDLGQRTIVGTLPSGGSLEIMYGAGGTIVGTGGATGNLLFTAPVQGTWTIDERGSVCTTMRVGGGGGAGGVGAPAGSVPPMTLPQRCQFWFKLGETYYLAESDSDRHARVLRRTLATATAAPAPITAATLPRAMKGNAVWSQGPATPTMLTWQLNPWSLAIAKTNSDGTFDGSITFVGPGCAARELPIANGVIQGGEVRFSVQMGARCPERFRLRGGSEHLLEGEAEFDAGARPARVWLDPS